MQLAGRGAAAVGLTANGSDGNFFRRPFVARLRFIQCPSRSRCGAPLALAPRWVDAQGAPPSTHVGRVARVQRVGECEGHWCKRVLTPISVRGAHLVAMRQTWNMDWLSLRGSPLKRRSSSMDAASKRLARGPASRFARAPRTASCSRAARAKS